MKNRVQRGSSLLLALACLLSLAACGEGSAETEAAETTADTAVTAETTEPELKDNLPALDYAGADMRILHFGSENAALKDAMGDDAGGDIVSDAVYNRNLQVEERLNIKFTWTAGSSDWGGYPNEVANMVLGGDCPYEMVFMESSQCFRLSLDGYFQDLIDLPYVELEQPWWYTGFMNGGAIRTDHRYYLTGAFSITTMEGASAIVVNKALFNNNFGDYNDLYDLVKEGAWTHDRFTEYCAAVYNDINGNGENDEA
ncbi:MAG: extracellular solute-binding protein, partial [Clostridia bacterium]|nr:extracellular solute-binding protein [Clostridia bacterium]